MKLKGAVLVFIFVVFSFSFVLAEENSPNAKQAVQKQDADQQINDFSLAGYGEKGNKTWDLAGKTADIFEDIIKLTALTGNLYGEKEDVRLTADKGDFDKSNGKIHVEQNVVITTSAGAKLTTDYLDWDRTNQVISTEARVNIAKENMRTFGTGAWGRPNLNLMTLKKDVMVEIQPQPKPGAKQEEPIVITSKGPLEVDYAKNVATFNQDVQVDRQDSQIYCDTLDLYFASNKENKGQEQANPPSLDNAFMGASIKKIVARGHVKTVRGENISYSQEAIYSGEEQKLTLSGRPTLLIYSTQDFSGLMSGAQ